MTPTFYRYRRRGEKSWQWEPFIVTDTWYYARAQARVILGCDNPEVEDSGLETLTEVIPPHEVDEQ